MVLLNKADLLSASETIELTNRLARDVRPGVRVIPVSHGHVDPAVLLGLGAAAEDDVDNRPTHHELDGELEHDHDDFVTFAVDLPEIADKAALLERISRAIEAHGILRLKGFAALESKPARLVVQATGPRVESWFDRPWRSDEARQTRLVVIGMKGLDEAAVRAALGAA
jgi:cobalamin biosynthesis protein CobW